MKTSQTYMPTHLKDISV